MSEQLRLLYRELQRMTGSLNEEDGGGTLIERRCFPGVDTEEVRDFVYGCPPHTILQPIFHRGLHYKPKCLSSGDVCYFHACLDTPAGHSKHRWCSKHIRLSEAELHMRHVEVWDLDERDMEPKWNHKWNHILKENVHVNIDGHGRVCMELDPLVGMDGLLLKISFSFFDDDLLKHRHECILLKIRGEKEYPLRIHLNTPRKKLVPSSSNNPQSTSPKQEEYHATKDYVVHDRHENAETQFISDKENLLDLHTTNQDQQHTTDSEKIEVVSSPSSHGEQAKPGESSKRKDGSQSGENKRTSGRPKSSSYQDIVYVDRQIHPVLKNPSDRDPSAVTSVPQTTITTTTTSLAEELDRIETKHMIVIGVTMAMFVFIVTLVGLTILFCSHRKSNRKSPKDKRHKRKKRRTAKKQDEWEHLQFNDPGPYDYLAPSNKFPPEPTYYHFRDRRRHLSEPTMKSTDSHLERAPSLSSMSSSSTTSEDRAFEQLAKIPPDKTEVQAKKLEEPPEVGTETEVKMEEIPVGAAVKDGTSDTGPVSPLSDTNDGDDEPLFQAKTKKKEKKSGKGK